MREAGYNRRAQSYTLSIFLTTLAGEGKHWIVVKRPEPLAANATVSYSVIASTVLAAGYTSYASKFTRRVGPASVISIPSLFIRASARAGVWCAAAGAAANWYYHHAFTLPISAASGVKDEKWKLWEKTERYTVDDGFLAGAGIGLVSGLVSAIALRRGAIPWWARCVGMANIGGFVGIAGSNAYFQYTGERQKSVLALEQWRLRRNLEFHWIYWNKLLLSSLPVPVQAYVMWNGIFHAARLPEEVLTKPEKYNYGMISDTSLPAKKTDTSEKSDKTEKSAAAEKTSTDNGAASDSSTASKAVSEKYNGKGHYRKARDIAETLKGANIEGWEKNLVELEQERQSLLKEAEYIAYGIARREYEYCHLQNADADERERLLREVQLMKIVFNRLRMEADERDRRMFFGRVSLAQKKAWDSDEDTPASWTRSITHHEGHEPQLSIKEFNKIREQLVKEIKSFEEKAKDSKTTAEQKEQAKVDLDDGRLLLRAADRVHYELEKKAEKSDAKEVKVHTKAKPPENMEPSKP